MGLLGKKIEPLTYNRGLLAQGERARNKPEFQMQQNTPQGLLDGAAMATSPVPILGDLFGLGADAYRFATDPSSRTPGNYGLAAFGLLPFVPSGLGKISKSVDLNSMRAVDVFGNGRQVKYYDDKGNFIEKKTLPNDSVTWLAGKAGKQEFLDNYLTDVIKGFDSADEAYSRIGGLLGAQTRKANALSKYGQIPKTWDAESKKIAKQLIDGGHDVSKFLSSTQSKSKYIELADGRKIRLSNHDLPRNYESADIDFRFGGDVSALLDSLKP